MASSAHNQPSFLQIPYGTTAAPPPTPSTQSNDLSTSDDSAADVLSRLLHRLPPTLSLPSRRQISPADATCPSLAYPNCLSGILAASQPGFFQLAGHPIPPQLARSAESDSLSLFDLPRDHKREWFPNNWPLGYDGGEDDDDDDSEVSGAGAGAGSFCLDSSCSTESTAELSLASLREFTRAMERLGMELVDALSCAVGFENPFRGVGDSGGACVMMWISEGKLDPGNEPGMTGRLYPYVVGLQYQIRCQKYALHMDSGRVSVEPQVGSILVTLGDIAQVWSNGKLKKVRGRPTAATSARDGNTSRCVTMSLLVTLPLASTVHPLTPLTEREAINGAEEEEDNGTGGNYVSEGHTSSSELKEGGEEGRRVFNSFCLEDYAWRVYHERLLFKDPLERYRF